MAWSRKKIVGVVLSVMFVLFLGASAAFYFLIVGIIKGSEPYKMTVKIVETNAVVAEKVGTITGYGFLPMGSVSVQNDSGKANISISIKGDKGKGKVKTFFYREGGQWFLKDGILYVKGEPTGISILPLEITSIMFHSESTTGPVNDKREYNLGETIYWNVVVEKARVKGGEVSLKEGLTIIDNEGNIIAENPDLVIFNEQLTGSNAVTFENHVTPPKVGEFTLKTTVLDRFSNRTVEREDKVNVVSTAKLGISNLNYREGSAEGPIIETPKYKKGETVHVTFQVVGFTLPGGNLSVSEDLYVMDDKDQLVLEKPNILQVNETWLPDDLLTLQNKIDIPDSGNFKLKINVRDLNADTSYTSITDFTIE